MSVWPTVYLWALFSSLSFVRSNFKLQKINNFFFRQLAIELVDKWKSHLAGGTGTKNLTKCPAGLQCSSHNPEARDIGLKKTGTSWCFNISKVPSNFRHPGKSSYAPRNRISKIIRANFALNKNFVNSWSRISK